MEALPREIVRVLRVLEDVFSERIWDWVQVVVVGAILTPGQRTVASVLRVMGLSEERQYQNYHRVLNRARWSSRELSRRLLALLVETFVAADGPVVVGLDETIERRRGAKIAATGIYRDPVRSSKSHVVKTSGLRWISMQRLAEVPWAGRIWGLPFLTVLAPSERYHQERGQRHKTRSDWGRQMIRHLRRWLPDRALVVVADSTYAVLDLLADAARLPEPVTVVTRLRLDAALYDPAPPRKPGTTGRPRIKGERRPTLATRLLDPDTVWETLTVPWYSGGTASVDVATSTAIWYHPGEPPVSLRWVLLRDPHGQFDPHALLQYRPDRAPSPDHRLVRRALAAGSDLPRGPRPPRRRDPAPMVGPRHPADHTGVARPLLAGDPLRPGSSRLPRRRRGPAPASPAGRLVCQVRPDLLRYPRLHPPPALARHRFSHVTVIRRHRRNPTRPLRPPHRYSGVRRLSSA